MNHRLILAGVDLGPRSASVLASAWDQASAAGARLVVVHCLDPRDLGDLAESARALLTALDGTIADRRARLEALCAEVGRPVHALRVERGDPVVGLLRAIGEWRPDLVVLGGRQRRLLPFCGVSERVSHASAAPVLLVPAVRPAPAPVSVVELRPARAAGQRLHLVK